LEDFDVRESDLTTQVVVRFVARAGGCGMDFARKVVSTSFISD
jgi:hypothetical protein